MSVFKVGSNKSSQNNFPSVRPTLDLDFANSKTLDPRITFTRASGGSYVGADGLIKYAGVNEPRFDHDPVTGESLGLLVEEARTNSTLHSQNLSNASWSKSNCNSTSNNAIAPDGTLTATKITTEANDNGGVVVNQNYTSTQNPVSFTYSIFAKAGTYRYIGIQGFTNVWSNTVVFDLQTGTIFTPSNFIGTKIAQIVSYGNGWYRCSVTYPAYFYFYYNFQFALTSYVGYSDYGIYDNNVSPTAGQFIYVWGAQLEAGAFPTSYIPTEASTRTRAADNASITGKNFSSWFSSSSGSLVSIAKTPPGVAWGSAQIIGGFGNGIYAQGAYGGTGMLVDGFHANGPWQTSGRVWISGVSYSLGGNLNFGYNDYTLQSRNAFIAWSPTESRYGINGELSSGFSSPMASTVAATVNKFIIGFGDNIDAYYYPPSTVHVKRLTFYPKRLTNQQLQVLTR